MKKIIFLGIGDVGDAVINTAILKAVRQHLPQASIHILLGSWNAGLLKGHSCVDKIYCYDYPWGNVHCGLKKNWLHKASFLFFSPLLSVLRKERFDAAICFSFSKFDWLLMFFLRAKMKIGRAQRGNNFFFTHITPDTNERTITRIEANLLLLEPLGIRADYCLPQLELDKEDRLELRTFFGCRFTEAKKIITICPGAGGSLNKRWLPEYFAEVTNTLASQSNHLVVLSGSPEEKTLIDTVKKYIKNEVMINYGKLSLRGFAALIEKSSLVVCNNSAPMHIAAALGRPAVVLNGGFNDQAEALKWGYKVNNIVILTADVGRRPSNYWHRPCENHECMRQIKPDLVLKEAQKLLDSSRAAELTEEVNSKVILTDTHCG